MKSSAQLEQLALNGTDDIRPATQTDALSLREAAAERLAAHRARRARLTQQADGQPAQARLPERGSSKKDQIAATVAQRYAQTPSYRAFLAEEAQRAAQQAAAAAEIAARNAEAVAAVQQELLAELELWTTPQEFSGDTATVTSAEPVAPGVQVESRPKPKQRTPRVAASAAPAADPATPVTQISAAGLTVRLYEDAGTIDGSVFDRTQPVRSATALPAWSEEEARALEELDEEIAFRQAPVFDAFSIDPPTPLPANLLEFPRQLVAAKKARPRLAEGPLREDAPRSPQLRIFEVEPEQISSTPSPHPTAAPEWTTMQLGAQPELAAATPSSAAYSAPDRTDPAALLPHHGMARLEPAHLSLRAMAALVDLGLISFALLGCIMASVKLLGWIPTGAEAILAAFGTLFVLYIGYVLLFFTLSDQTPGMRYARIGLCTFDDENPSRSAMRQRLIAQLIAAIPLGLGLLWALLDEESLGWHDRMTRMYQRAY